MNQRTALLIAAALTTFVLVMVAGVATRLIQPSVLAPTSTTAALDVAPAMPPALDPSVEALVREREATYQTALAEANTRLEAANAQIAIANGQVATTTTQQAAPTYAFTPDQAQASALAAAPGSSVMAVPELVSYEGTPAYEVQLDRGLVYVDARSGAVLYNGAVPVAQKGVVGQEQAIQAAIAYHDGGEVVAVHLDDEEGVQVYEVEFSDDSTIYINAGNGQVVYADIKDGGERDDD